MKLLRALISVSDKDGIVELAKSLCQWNVDILSTGGTAKLLREAGVTVTDVSDYTGSPEILGGRVKTLHPKVHGGLLYIRGDEKHEQERTANGIGPIDLVVVNLYPFEQTVAREGVSVEEAIENIDIGGPSMIRSGAKNHASVAVATDPAQYPALCDELKANDGSLSDATRRRLAVEAFALTARYDSAIHRYLHNATEPDQLPTTLTVPLRQVQILRYGENPHQTAGFYERLDHHGPSLARIRQLNGKELSYNNLLDLDAAYQIAASFKETFCCILKHNNPCGAAISTDLKTAYDKAYAGDPLSAFGSILGFNRTVDAATADAMTEPGRFVEAVIAPGFDDAALKILTTKPKWRNNVRLIAMDDFEKPGGLDSLELRDVAGGLLLQSRDRFVNGRDEWKVVTQEKPDAAMMDELVFAWQICRFVKSNAITLTLDRSLVGAGAGQMSRVDAAQIAVTKAADRAPGCVVGSDAFIPFRDLVDLVAQAGASAIIQPGGSKRDDEVIEACNSHGVAMVFTNERHFRH